MDGLDLQPRSGSVSKLNASPSSVQLSASQFRCLSIRSTSIPDLTRERSNHASSGQRLDSRRRDSHDDLRRD